MNPKIFQVDAFTNTPFAGNPAAVCLLSKSAPAEWMQQVGAEMNLSETAFLWPLEDGYSLRWFTPTTEVDLCGHATLASAHILWQTGVLKAKKTAVFRTKSGRLTASLDGDWIELDFPAAPPQPALLPDGIQELLNVDPLYVGEFGPGKYLIVVANEQIVRDLQPDFNALALFPARSICVTAIADSWDLHFVSRFFAPWVGINEDPVTGSAHCCLAPYWSAELGQKNLDAYQASARGGLLKLQNVGDRVLIRGQAVTVLKGKLLV